jgi:Lon-like protease
MKRMSKRNKNFFFILLFLLILAFIPTPYFLYQPGTTDDLSSLVNVEDGYKEEKGNFYLTTVLSSEASNIYYLLYGLLAPHTEIKKASDVQQDFTDQEYDDLLNFMMRDSKQNAIVSSFSEAGEDLDVDYNGIFVYGISEQSKANGILKVGDIITEVDGTKVSERNEFIDYIEKNKKAGDTVSLKFGRNGKTLEEKIEIITLDKETNRIGLGITPEEEFNVDVARKVELNSEDIGGPSAGLMFSLEIYKQLVEKDLTKGYEIAGTGTIDHEGNIGQIGGIRHKVTTASLHGTDIFFVPKDLTELDTNENDALDEAKNNGYDLEIVPVATLAEAIKYLENLKEK